MVAVPSSGGKEVRILIAASHTGGHLFPALAVAEALKHQAPSARIEFIGSGRPLEEEILGAAGWVPHKIEVVGIKNRGLKGVAQFALRIPTAVLQTWRLISRVRPQVIIGIGGYVTFFPIVLGWLRGIPTWIHEAEEQLGLANSVLVYFAQRLSLAHAVVKLPPGCRVQTMVTGQPVRPELLRLAKEQVLREQPKHLLVLGGSQGARALDRALAVLAPVLAAQGVEVWHQCRPEEAPGLQQAYQRAGVSAKVTPFVHDMVTAYQWADLVVARSGAGTVRELGVLGKPAIFVPLPHSQADHQRLNAESLVRVGKALLVEEGELFSERLQEALTWLLVPENYQRLATAKYEAAALTAADQIAAACLEYCR